MELERGQPVVGGGSKWPLELMTPASIVDDGSIVRTAIVECHCLAFPMAPVDDR